MKDTVERADINLTLFSRNVDGNIYNYTQAMAFDNAVQNILKYLGVFTALKAGQEDFNEIMREFEQYKLFFDTNTYNALYRHLKYSASFIVDTIRGLASSQIKVLISLDHTDTEHSLSPYKYRCH